MYLAANGLAKIFFENSIIPAMYYIFKSGSVGLETACKSPRREETVNKGDSLSEPEPEKFIVFLESWLR
jgi:hypothetical protein